jgi:hypothetical protein
MVAEQNRTSAVAPTGAILFSMAGNLLLAGGSGAFGYAAVSTLDNSTILALTFYGAAGTTGANKVGFAVGIDTP